MIAKPSTEDVPRFDPATMEPPATSSRRLWVFAAIVALLLHAGGVALAVARMQPDDSDDDLGAPSMEIGLELAAPRAEPTDLPPGPDTDASAASPAVAEQKAVVKETELPQAVPTETEDPDRVVTPDESKKPTPDDPEKAAVAAAASTESVAAEATAMPTSESAKVEERSVAPAQGTGQSMQRIRTTWQKELFAHLNKFKRYPVGSARRNVEITVSFTIDRLGHVQAVNLVKGSGDAAFDEAALAMVRRSDPVPPPPARVADEGLTFTLPVIFRVKDRR